MHSSPPDGSDCRLLGGEGAAHYKASRFNAQATSPDGGLIVTNSLRRQTIFVQPAWAARVRNVLRSQEPADPPDLITKMLVSSGYMVESAHDEWSAWRRQHEIDHSRSDHLHLIIIAHQDCNFRCSYCCQRFEPRSIEPTVLTSLKLLLESRIGELRSVRVSWFGGEPLLALSSVRDYSMFAQALCASRGVSFTSQMTTNGYLLDSATLHQLVHWGVRQFQVTLDGPAEVHDRRRPLANGGPSFQTILENLTAARDSHLDFKGRIRVNYDLESYSELSALFTLLQDRVGADPRFMVGFQPVEHWGTADDPHVGACGADLFAYERSIRRRTRDFGVLVESAARHLATGNVCHATDRNTFVVGATGALMKCTVALEREPYNIVGRLRSDGLMELDDRRMALWTRPHFANDDSCRSCFFVPLCHGASCPLKRIQTGERPCPTVKKHIRSTLVELWTEQTGAASPSTNQETHPQLTGDRQEYAL